MSGARYTRCLFLLSQTLLYLAEKRFNEANPLLQQVRFSSALLKLSYSRSALVLISLLQQVSSAPKPSPTAGQNLISSGPKSSLTAGHYLISSASKLSPTAGQILIRTLSYSRLGFDQFSS